MRNLRARWGEYLRHTKVWCRRFGHRRCWRIHSPFAYRFVREVVFATPTPTDRLHLATAQRAARHTYRDHTWQRYHRLGYRLARHQALRHAQAKATTPLHWVIIAPNGQSAFLPYLQAAAQLSPELHISVQCYPPEAFAASVTALPDLLYLDSIAPTQLAWLFSLLPTAAPHTLLLIRPIYHTPQATALWQSVEHHPATVVTFDLFYLGIALFHTGLSKEAHKLCF